MAAMPSKSYVGGLANTMKPKFIDFGVAIIPTDRIRSIQKYEDRYEISTGWFFNPIRTIRVEYRLWIDDYGDLDVTYSEATPWDLLYKCEEERNYYYSKASGILREIDNEPTETIQEDEHREDTDVGD